jgi:hypothetical protein
MGHAEQIHCCTVTKLSSATDGTFSDANAFVQGATLDGANRYINMDVAYDDTYFDSFGNAQR